MRVADRDRWDVKPGALDSAWIVAAASGPWADTRAPPSGTDEFGELRYSNPGPVDGSRVGMLYALTPTTAVALMSPAVPPPYRHRRPRVAVIRARTPLSKKERGHLTKERIRHLVRVAPVRQRRHHRRCADRQRRALGARPPRFVPVEHQHDALRPTQQPGLCTRQVTVGPRDFLRQVSLALGLPPHGTAAAVFEAIQRSIRTTWAEHRIHPVLVLDEVHLPDRTLSHLHVLTNFDLDSNPLLSLILVGLPGLQDRLKLGVHRSLLTRIRTSVQVSPTTLADTAAYVSRRLELVGSRSDIFVSDGMTMLHELAAGVPRVVDTLAWRAMQLAAQREERVISRATVRRAWQDTPLA
jgi:hypothetical protein